jgi:phosphate transport system protein
MVPHTVRSFDDDLRQVRALVAQMGGILEAQLRDAVIALTEQDSDRALRVVMTDKVIDQLERQTEQAAIQVIARRAPLADDLRELISAIRISSVIERMGDYAKNIAKRATVLADVVPPQPMVIVPEMARLASMMVKDVLDAYASRDLDLAHAVWQRDEELDSLYTTLFRSLLTYMMEKPQHITACAHLLFVAKNIERIGDNATNIAEIVHYNVTGLAMDEDRPKSDELPIILPDPGQPQE